MSEREWQDGDVAMVTFINDSAQRAVRRGGVWVFLDSEGYGIDAYARDPRPLVVIDPEDREQVERLLRLHLRATVVTNKGVDNMQRALREFANPTPPKPDEPLGLGAVVEDAEGKAWIRAARIAHGWHQPMNKWAAWSDIAAVKILSEGVS